MEDRRRLLEEKLSRLLSEVAEVEVELSRAEGAIVGIPHYNWRVKGTEMFWNNPEGAEAILQIRAAALSEDGRLKRHLQNRLGSPFTRRRKPASLRPQKIKPPPVESRCGAVV